jgi:muscarinic acetylcholine receptor M3
MSLAVFGGGPGENYLRAVSAVNKAVKRRVTPPMSLSPMPVNSLAMMTTVLWADDGELSSWNTSSTMTSLANTTLAVDVSMPLVQLVPIAVVCVILALITAIGNVMVMISFKMDVQLQTVSNAFLLSLSMADFTIGLVSMPLYSIMLLARHWPFGPLLCDIWLSLDYTMSNASVANLLIICFDRYLSITRPLTYRAKRTPARATVMISTAWIVSVLLWTPWIFAWPYIDGNRLVPEDKCYVQFLFTNRSITVITTIIAFYLPVAIMITLYLLIYSETQKRQKDLRAMQSGKAFQQQQQHEGKVGGLTTDDERAAATGDESTAEGKPLDRVNSCASPPQALAPQTTLSVPRQWFERLLDCCHGERSGVPEESSSSEPHALNSPAEDVFYPPCSYMAQHNVDRGAKQRRHRRLFARSSPASFSTGLTSMSQHSNALTQLTDISTDVIQLADVSNTSHCQQSMTYENGSVTEHVVHNKTPTIGIVSEESEEDNPLLGKARFVGGQTYGNGDMHQLFPASITTSHTPPPYGDLLSPTLSAPADADSLGPSRAGSVRHDAQSSLTTCQRINKQQAQTARRKRQESRQDRKAAKTLSAILLAFIVTWTPYSVFTLINVWCNDCINPTLYSFGKFNAAHICYWQISNGGSQFLEVYLMTKLDKKLAVTPSHLPAKLCFNF